MFALLLAASALPLFAAGVPVPPPASVTRPAPPVATLHHDEYRKLAAGLAAGGAGLSEVFRGLCGRMLAQPRFRRMPMGEVRSLFLGLVEWSREGRPRLQDREDLALHFAYGGLAAATLGRAAADEAGWRKEERDAAEPGNAFDLDDYGATLLAAGWVASLGRDQEAVEGWVRSWADGSRTLAGLPALRFGALPPGRVPGSESRKAVRDFAARAMAHDR